MRNRICDSSGPVKITVIDKNTGEVLLSEEGYVTSYQTRLTTPPQVHTLGGDFIEYLGPIVYDMNINLRLFPQEEVEAKPVAPKAHEHTWVEYNGFSERYDYCKVCGTKA